MKRIAVLTLLAVLLFCACGTQNVKLQSPVHFYYLNEAVSYNSPDAIISSELHEGAGYETDLQALISVYLLGPSGKLHLSPFPDRLTVDSITIEEGTAFIVLSDQICMLTGHELTLACVCLGRTIMGVTGVTAVNISVSDRLIGGKSAITITSDNLLYADTSVIDAPSQEGSS